MKTDATTIRLTLADRRNIKVVISSGSARNVSEAIRVSLYEAAEKRKSSSGRSESGG